MNLKDMKIGDSIMVAKKDSDKILFDSEWIQVRQMDGWYDYVHNPKAPHGVCVLVFNPKTKQVLGRYELTPPHGPEIKLTSLTGGMDKEGKDQYDIALMELQEEAGIEATKEDLIDLGWIWAGKSSDSKSYLFGLDGSNKELGEAKGDGFKGEEGSYVKWISTKEGILATSSYIAACIARLHLKGINLLGD